MASKILIAKPSNAASVRSSLILSLARGYWFGDHNLREGDRSKGWGGTIFAVFPCAPPGGNSDKKVGAGDGRMGRHLGRGIPRLGRRPSPLWLIKERRR